MSADTMHYYPPSAIPSAGYTYCRSGSDSRLHRRGSHRDVVDAFDSGDSTLSDLEADEPNWENLPALELSYKPCSLPYQHRQEEKLCVRCAKRWTIPTTGL
ncbi:hypothetical protein JTB14_029208 [Gonioctena quinquepunctata]|nr:hypothetical protein JTB14_029208 [Gonioctena quinquepunctata]